MSVINTNVKSLVASSTLAINDRALSTAMEQLSTGKRINSAKDDAAGMAISSRMTAQIRGSDQAVRNANDGISLLQTADGAMEEVSNMLQRMRELSVQSLNGTNGATDTTALSDEFDSLAEEIGRINDETKWNGDLVFSDAEKLIQVGANKDNTIDFTIAAIDVSGSDITDLSTIDTDIDTLNDQRAYLGAKINRLSYASNNAMNISQNTSASRSRIMDTDYAKTSAELARTQIVQQAATAMLAQANQSTQSVLALLK